MHHIFEHTAVFGGAFNPPHLGHIGIAAALSRCDKFEKIIIVPSNLIPDKKISEPFDERLKLAELAFGNIPKVKITDIAYHYGDCIYTTKLVRRLHNYNRDAKIHFTMGSDRLLNIRTWYNWKGLLRIAGIIVVA